MTFGSLKIVWVSIAYSMFLAERANGNIIYLLFGLVSYIFEWITNETYKAIEWVKRLMINNLEYK